MQLRVIYSLILKCFVAIIYLIKKLEYFNYSEDLKIVFSIDNLRGWKYTHMPDTLPVDYYYETKSDYFEPYEFECNVNNLTSNKYKLELIKDKIMRQILLDMECDDKFRIHPEILEEYRPDNE